MRLALSPSSGCGFLGSQTITPASMVAALFTLVVSLWVICSESFEVVSSLRQPPAAFQHRTSRPSRRQPVVHVEKDAPNAMTNKTLEVPLRFPPFDVASFPPVLRDYALNLLSTFGKNMINWLIIACVFVKDIATMTPVRRESLPGSETSGTRTHRTFCEASKPRRRPKEGFPGDKRPCPLTPDHLHSLHVYYFHLLPQVNGPSRIPTCDPKQQIRRSALLSCCQTPPIFMLEAS